MAIKPLPALVLIWLATCLFLLLTQSDLGFLFWMSGEAAAPPQQRNIPTTDFGGRNPCYGLCHDPSECFCDNGFFLGREHVQDASATLQKELWDMQHPQNCSAHTILYMEFGKAVYGLGAKLFWLSVALSYGYRHGLVVTTANPDPWPTYWGNCTDGFECSFLPVSSCAWNSSHSRVAFNEASPVLTSLINFHDGSYGKEEHQARYWVPAKYTKLGLGTKWWRSQLIKYLFRPRPELADYFATAQARVGLTPGVPVIGLHIRKGADKKLAGEIAGLANMVPPREFQYVKAKLVAMDLPDFMTQVEALNTALEGMGEARVHTLLLATDDPGIVEQTKVYPQYTFLYDHEEERGLDYLAGKASAPDVLKTLHLLGQCDYMVFTMSSCFGRFGFQLGLANRMRMGISLDCSYYASP